MVRVISLILEFAPTSAPRRSALPFWKREAEGVSLLCCLGHLVSGGLQDRVKGTDAEAHAAADALFLMNDKRLRRFLGSCDRFHRAVLLAQAAELARLGIHAVLNHGL